jgi:hypothetical protein
MIKVVDPKFRDNKTQIITHKINEESSWFKNVKRKLRDKIDASNRKKK